MADKTVEDALSEARAAARSAGDQRLAKVLHNEIHRLRDPAHGMHQELLAMAAQIDHLRYYHGPVLSDIQVITTVRDAWEDVPESEEKAAHRHYRNLDESLAIQASRMVQAATDYGDRAWKR